LGVAAVPSLAIAYDGVEQYVCPDVVMLLVARVSSVASEK
jgi:hypothetical protein